MLSLLLLSTALLAPQDPPPADDRFALALFAQLRERPGNLFLSPHSVDVALSMALAGAGGETAAQMAALLGVPPDQAAARARRLAQALAPRYSKVRDAAPGQEPVPPYEFDLVNAAWAAAGQSLEPAYLDTLEEGFGAPLLRVDFTRAEAAAAEINAWAKGRTDGRIDPLVAAEDFDPNTALVLVNAIRFRSPWQAGFSERQTHQAAFKTSAGREVEVPMMRRQEVYGYAETEALQAVELDYRGRQLSMLVLLPKQADGLPELEATLTAAGLRRLDSALAPTGVDLRLPRFRVDSSFRLDQPLKDAGMPDAFDGARADFSGIADERLWVSAVLHQASVAVDEKGTEASAATAVVLEKRAGIPRSEVGFTADHPFLFLIRHRATGTLLFLGRVADPTAG
ncbi:MAG: serpin family protein [Planctomycetes bacterium]|nr:serpin family protein [Planctomycetota bacterium]